MFLKKYRHEIAIFIIILILSSSGFGCKFTSSDVQEAMKPIELNYWRVFDDSDSMEGIINAYKAIHPNITINYRKLRYEEYEDEILNALAEDRGPDIFSLHNTWMRKYKPKLMPMPAQTTLAQQVEKGSIKKELVTELITKRSMTLKELKNDFVDVVYDDVVMQDIEEDNPLAQEKIYGLPLAVDNMALFYNKELLNIAGIAEAPKTWEDFQEAVKKITKQDRLGNIKQAGAALGTSSNVERSSDILSVLMMQNGTQMTRDNYATFDQIPEELADRNVAPAEEALRFYTDFSSPAKEVYTWNETMPPSLDAFMQGNVGFFFGYAYHIPTIKANAPKLDFGIAELPQIDVSGLRKVNYANYWIETVSKKTQYPDEAWDFLQFAAAAENVTKYLQASEKPTALKALVNTQLDDIDIGVFAAQVLTAKSWYKGNDPLAMENIFNDLITDVVNGEITIKEGITLAAAKVNQTFR